MKQLIYLLFLSVPIKFSMRIIYNTFILFQELIKVEDQMFCMQEIGLLYLDFIGINYYLLPKLSFKIFSVN